MKEKRTGEGEKKERKMTESEIPKYVESSRVNEHVEECRLTHSGS